jgi:hypothetical protein
MKRCVSIIVAMLSAFCATTLIGAEYTWDVSITPISAREYQFRAKLKQYTAQGSVVDSGGMQESENILNLPTLKVTPDKPAEGVIGEAGKEPNVKAKVVMQETPQKVVFTYSAMVTDGTTRHTTQGKIEINR